MVPMFVMMAMSGCAMDVRYAISPKWFMPISKTATSTSSSSAMMLMGRPRSLLWFPSLFAVRNAGASAQAIISFVVVFPTLPVMPMTRVCRSLR